MRFLVLLFISIILANTAIADEVYLNNGKAWINVNVLENLSTNKEIIIYTSMNKKIPIKFNMIIGIKYKKFNPRKKSKLIELEEPYVAEDDKNYEEHIEPESISSVNSDSFLVSLPRNRLNIGGGFSYRTFKMPSNIPNELEEYISDMKKGYNISVDFAYFFSPKFGVVFQYSNFFSSNSMSGIYYEDEYSGESGVGSIEDNITISYFGLGLNQRKYFESTKSILISSLTMGVVNYNNDSRVISFPLDIEGTSFGAKTSIDWDFFITDRFLVGPSISYLGSTMEKIKVNGEEIKLEDKEDLSHLNFNVSVKLYF